MQELEHSATEAMPEEAVQSLAKADLETHSKAPKQTEDVRPLGDEAEQLKGALETFPDRQQPASPADAQQATPSLSEATPKEESNIPQGAIFALPPNRDTFSFDCCTVHNCHAFLKFEPLVLHDFENSD